MRPSIVTLNAIGVSPWIPVNYKQLVFGVGLAIIPSSNIAALTCKAQLTFDDPGPDSAHSVSVSQTLTTLTVTDPGGYQSGGAAFGHGLSVGDSVTLTQSGLPGVDGTWPVASVVSQNQYTITLPGSASQSSAFTMAQPFRVFDHASLTAVSARANGSIGFPVAAVRLSVSAIGAGYVSLAVLQGEGPG